MKGKLLTFSIAAYNAERFLDKCVRSMVSCENRSDIEILVIDDGSSDGTAQIAGE